MLRPKARLNARSSLRVFRPSSRASAGADGACRRSASSRRRASCTASCSAPPRRARPDRSRPPAPAPRRPAPGPWPPEPARRPFIAADPQLVGDAARLPAGRAMPDGGAGTRGRIQPGQAIGIDAELLPQRRGRQAHHRIALRDARLERIRATRAAWIPGQAQAGAAHLPGRPVLDAAARLPVEQDDLQAGMQVFLAPARGAVAEGAGLHGVAAVQAQAGVDAVMVGGIAGRRLGGADCGHGGKPERNAAVI